MNYKQTLYIFYTLILEVFIIGVESFVPVGRVGHCSILVGTKLYFFGGATGNNISSNEVFYLDASQTFKTASPPWTDLTKIPFGSSWAGMSLINVSNDPTAYLFGGINDLGAGNFSIIYSFHIKTLEWKVPFISVKIPERIAIHAVSNKENLYVFGGSDQLVGPQYFNDMIMLDTINLAWSYGSRLNAPIPHVGYSATILTNGLIVYIGGQYRSGEVIDISQINLYNTNTNAWSTVIANNTNSVASRFNHSAVLTPDNDIIIYGGSTVYNVGSVQNLVSIESDIAVLNQTHYEWMVPNVSSNVGKPPSLYGTTANLIGNYMIVTFGVLPSYNNSVNYNSKIYIMDIRNYTWVDTFDPINSSLTQKLKIVIGVVSGIIGIKFLSVTGFLGYKWYKKYKRKQDLQNMYKDFRIL